ncbi:MAG: GYF domain-containing protein [Thermoguttaceae bacterium]|nr:GYF domain-containing protein [Thermoguttaceae bacterium]
MQWYYMKADTKERFGPFSDAELKQEAASGKLLPTDFIWRQGMQKAALASKVRGLFPQTAAPAQTPGVPSRNPNTSTGLPSGSGTVPLAKPQAVPGNQGARPAASQAASVATPVPQAVTRPVPMPEPQQQAASPFASDNQFDFPAPPSESDTPLHWEPSPIQTQRSATAASAMADSSQPRPQTREEQLWEEGSSSLGVWKILHKIVASNLWLCFVIPLAVALPVGILTGILEAMNPIIYISFIGVMVVYSVLGMIVFECFKGAGIRVRILSSAYGFLIACIGVWAFVYGGLLWDAGVIVPGEEPEISAVNCLSPIAMVVYIKVKAENMTMGRVGRHDSDKPSPFFNYLFILGMLVVEVVCTVTTAWGPMKLKSEEEAEAAGSGY